MSHPSGDLGVFNTMSAPTMSDIDTDNLTFDDESVVYEDEFEHDRYCCYCEEYVPLVTYIQKDNYLEYYPDPEVVNIGSSPTFDSEGRWGQKVYRILGKVRWFHVQCKRNCIFQNLSLFKQVNGKFHMKSTHYKYTGRKVKPERVNTFKR